MTISRSASSSRPSAGSGGERHIRDLDPREVRLARRDPSRFSEESRARPRNRLARCTVLPQCSPSTRQLRGGVRGGPRNRSIRLSNPCTEKMVGATGFEPATSSSRTKRATRLRHAPTGGGVWRLLTVVSSAGWVERSFGSPGGLAGRLVAPVRHPRRDAARRAALLLLCGCAAVRVGGCAVGWIAAWRHRPGPFWGALGELARERWRTHG